MLYLVCGNHILNYYNLILFLHVLSYFSFFFLLLNIFSPDFNLFEFIFLIEKGKGEERGEERRG